VEIALFAPLMLLAVMVALQAAAWGLADLSARHAAQHGVQTARLHGATAADGHNQATALLAEINPRGLTNVQITVDRNPATTTITISGAAIRVIPIIAIPVHAQAHAPTEPAG
jgi:hypothetical protein